VAHKDSHNCLSSRGNPHTFKHGTADRQKVTLVTKGLISGTSLHFTRQNYRDWQICHTHLSFRYFKLICGVGWCAVALYTVCASGTFKDPLPTCVSIFTL